MSAADSWLTAEEVQQVITYISDCDPIVVGGQSVTLLADLYAGSSEALAKMGTISSKDIDFFENARAAEKLAGALINGTLRLPDSFDTTPNAAVVLGNLNGRYIRVDFMRAVLGVDDDKLKNRFVSISGTLPGSNEEISLAIMHPIDCLASRLANLGPPMNRRDDHSIAQLTASIFIVEAFFDDLANAGLLSTLQKFIIEYEYLIRDKLYRGSAEYSLVRDLPDPLFVRKYLSDERFDARWRERSLSNSIDRLEGYKALKMNRAILRQ